MIAFLNPDQIPKIGFEPELLGDIYPWLRFMLEQEGMGVADKEIRESFLRSVGTIAIELVENMRDHAELGFNGLCSLSVFNTDSTLYISAFDNGRGTVASLAEWPHSLTHLSPQERLLLPFSSNMLRGPRNRGDGIQRRIVARTHALQGSVFMTSSAQEGTVYVTHNYTEEPRVSTQAGLKTQGTTTVVAIPLAPLL